MSGNVRARNQNNSNNSRQPGWVLDGLPLNLAQRRNHSMQNAAVLRREPVILKLPVFVVAISIVQALVFFFWTPLLVEKLISTASRPCQIWRFVIGPLIHHDICHLFEGIFGQIVLGIALETAHHWKRTAIIVVGGNMFCVLMSILLHPGNFVYGSSLTTSVLWTTSIMNYILNPEFYPSYASHYLHVWGLIWPCLWSFLRGGHLYSFVNYITAAVGGFLIAGSCLKFFCQDSWKIKLRGVCRTLLATCIFMLIVRLVYYPASNSQSIDGNTMRILETIRKMNKLSLTNQFELFTANLESIVLKLIE